MVKNNCFLLKKIAVYEINYLFKKFKPVNCIVSLVYIVATIITGLDDAKSFFIGENSPIPTEWFFFKDETVALIISVCVIVIPATLVLIAGYRQNSKDASELSITVQDNVVPSMGVELKALKTRLKKKYKLDETIRLSIFVPIRKSLFCWYFQMVCRTENVSERELNALFGLDEGVLGYTFLKTKKHSMEFVDVSNPNILPNTYTPLSQENSNLINRNIKGVLVLAAFQEGSIAGLLAIDTDNLTNLRKLEGYELHSDALDWIVARSRTIRLLWRMKNNV